MKSEKWNEYSKAKVRNTLPKELPILTEKQWNKKGYVKISDDVGQLMRPNQMATSSYDIKLYLFPEEVRPATADELYVLKEPERLQREKRLELKRAKEEQREEEIRIAYEEKEKAECRLCSRTRFFLQEIMKLKGITPNRIIIIDTETTGLEWYKDEILQLSIIDDSENTLINELFKPINHTSWVEAQAVNGISPEMVDDKPTIQDKIIEIQEIITSAAVIIGYNTEFDINFLTNTGIYIPDETECIDVMRLYANFYGVYSEYFGCNKWCKLTEAAAHYDYKFKAHDSLEDCKATLHVYNKMREEGLI